MKSVLSVFQANYALYSSIMNNPLMSRFQNFNISPNTPVIMNVPPLNQFDASLPMPFQVLQQPILSNYNPMILDPLPQLFDSLNNTSLNDDDIIDKIIQMENQNSKLIERISNLSDKNEILLMNALEFVQEIK